MDNVENLTLFQKLAIEGEIALLFAGAKHDFQVLRRLYLIVSSAPSDIACYAVQVFKKFSTLPEEQIDRVLLEVSMKEYPEWLWFTNVIEDIKAATKISATDTMMNPDIKVDKKAIKEATVKSAFAYFCREACTEDEGVVVRLCQRILDEGELDFLSTICASFLEGLGKYSGNPDYDENPSGYISEEIFSLDFNPAAILSFTSEKKIYKKFLKAEAYLARQKEDDESAPARGIPEEVINSIFSPQTKYAVIKSYKGSSRSSVLNKFSSMKEAQEFVKVIEENYPELKDTCEFKIREIRDESGKEL